MSLSNGKVIISPSRVKMYKECQAKYYFEYVYKALKNSISPEVFGPGSILHKLADEYISLKLYKNDLSAKAEEEKIAEMIAYEKLDADKFTDRIKKEYLNLKNFLNGFLFNDDVLRVVPEAKISVPYRKDYNFFGYIDLKIMWKDGTVEIIDFKTSEERDNHSLQMGIYAYGVAKKNDIRVSKLVTGVYYTRFDAYESESWDMQKLKGTILEVEKILRKIEKQTSYKKMTNKYCCFCQHKGTCESWNGNSVEI